MTQIAWISAMPNEIIVGLMSAMFAGVLVAITNQLFLFPKTRAEARKIRADAAKTEAETSKALKDSDLDEAAAKWRDPKLPNGWFSFGDASVDYEMGIDDQVRYAGRASGYIRSRRFPRGFGSLTQKFKSDVYRGARLQMTAFVRTANVENWAGIWMRVDSSTETITIDNMQDRPIRGTTGWTKYAVVLDIAKDSKYIAFGILLAGNGQAWIADIQLNVVGRDIPTTDIPPDVKYPEHPINLDFET